MLIYKTKPNQSKFHQDLKKVSLRLKTCVDIQNKTESNQDSLPVKTRVDIRNETESN